MAATPRGGQLAVATKPSATGTSLALHPTSLDPLAERVIAFWADAFVEGDEQEADATQPPGPDGTPNKRDQSRNKRSTHTTPVISVIIQRARCTRRRRAANALLLAMLLTSALHAVALDLNPALF